MPEHDLEKLLGGFAADSLTPEEKQALYATALQDQQLFNALADEQALKEMLSDPGIRRRLLASLEQNSPEAAIVSSWLDLFRRPAGLAFAGSLTAAALAVVLGVRIYQGSLEQTAQSVGTEAVKPAAPSVPTPSASERLSPRSQEPQPSTKETAEPTKDIGKKDELLDRMIKREQPAPMGRQEQKGSSPTRGSATDRTAQDETDKKANTPRATTDNPSEGASSADQTAATSSPQPITAQDSKKMEMPAVSARALFYSAASAGLHQDRMAPEQERAMKPLTESTPQANRLERKPNEISKLGKAGDIVAQRPLGLRYSFVIREANGQEREVDGVTASKGLQPIFLTLEANQEAYLQVWKKTINSSTPQLKLPEKETGQLSLKMIAGHRQYIPLPVDHESATLTARLSPVPFGPTTKQEATGFDRPSPYQLQESIMANNQTSSPERATYVVNQDLSTSARITVDIINR